MQGPAKPSQLHFHLDFQLPEQSTLDPYTKKAHSTNKTKNKNRLAKFTYYHTPKGILKMLYLDDDNYIDQGYYPFTDPPGQIRSVKELKGPIERIVYSESVYISHYLVESPQGERTMLVLKKIAAAKFNSDTSEIETVDDKFEVLVLGNPERFQQFLKVQLANPNAGGSSIRVMIDEKFGEEKPAEVLDFQFFSREETLKTNKLYSNLKGKLGEKKMAELLAKAEEISKKNKKEKE